MTVTTTHRFRTPRQDGPPLDNIQPSHWNAGHLFTAANGVLIGRYSAGSGPAQEISLGANFAYDEGVIQTAGVLTVNSLTLGTPLPVDQGGFGGDTTQEAKDALLADLAAMITAVVGSTAPTGFLKANGAAVSRATYARLFSRIGTAFGVGDGSTTFNLPDFRGEFIRCWDDGRGVDAGRALGSFQNHATLSHAHSASFTTSTDGSHAHSMFDIHGAALAGTASLGARKVAGGGAIVAGARGTDGGGSHAHSFSVNTSSAGAGGEFRPRNVAMLICIKY